MAVSPTQYANVCSSFPLLDSNTSPNSLMNVINGQFGKEFKEANLKGHPCLSCDHPSNDDSRQSCQTSPRQALDQTACVRFGNGRCGGILVIRVSVRCGHHDAVSFKAVVVTLLFIGDASFASRVGHGEWISNESSSRPKLSKISHTGVKGNVVIN
jgi:hypothetical protein